jgi:hypothetical protein
MYRDVLQSLPEPSPLLPPRDVVKFQLDALQNNDLMYDNEGIMIAFRYASPHNRKALGSLNEFIKLLKQQSYRAMIGFERAELEPLHMQIGGACQHVHLIRREGIFSYLFLLSRQQEEPFSGCWMTDAVLPV